ncbi:hypothetical protein [Bacillus sp. FJAT-47783]|uniref:hypothetical protein n=1 Tax=Bacillus sp. FJAT-47783 TaxID=2922712 RepID=UPI001FACFCAD|nr:hypothetical protein [Bacillus sp. FJAT-47783]
MIVESVYRRKAMGQIYQQPLQPSRLPKRKKVKQLSFFTAIYDIMRKKLHSH